MTQAKAEIIKADVNLQAKVGTGAVSQETVARCQQTMEHESKKTDFAPLAAGYLDSLKNTISKAKSGEYSLEETTRYITDSVMQLKANSSTFGYPLVGNLANIMLNFLESVQKIDSDVIAIVAAHQTTLSLIIKQKMKGDGGVHGQLLETELQKAVQRYHDSKKAKTVQPA